MDLQKMALVAFVDAINAAGGVTKDFKGHLIPVCDEDWIDLGEAYRLACLALGQEPRLDLKSE